MRVQAIAHASAVADGSQVTALATLLGHVQLQALAWGCVFVVPSSVPVQMCASWKQAAALPEPAPATALASERGLVEVMAGVLRLGLLLLPMLVLLHEVAVLLLLHEEAVLLLLQEEVVQVRFDAGPLASLQALTFERAVASAQALNLALARASVEALPWVQVLLCARPLPGVWLLILSHGQFPAQAWTFGHALVSVQVLSWPQALLFAQEVAFVPVPV